MTETSPNPKPRQLAPVRNPRVIAVASGKGGVGKTWFSITLTHSLAKLGRNVLLFDSDLGLANIDIQLGLMPERDLSIVISEQASIDKAKVRYELGNFDVIAGRSGSAALASLPASRLAGIRDDLMELSKSYDHVVIDLGAGIERTIRAMAKDANTTLVVTNDEPTSLTDAYTFIKVTLTDNPAADVRVVINNVHSYQEGERTYQTLVKACGGFLKYEPPLAGIIRYDRKVPDSIRAQTPILKRHPNTEAAKDVEHIAARLIA